MKRVLPREVVQPVKVPTTLTCFTELIWDVGKELPRARPVVCVLLWASSPMCTTGNLPSMHVCSGETLMSTNAVPTCSPQYSPLFASRACDTVETGVI